MRETVKKWGFALAAVVLAAGLASCAGGNKAEKPSPSASPSPSAPADTIHQGAGEFVGLADGHTAEIIVDGTPTAFQFDSAKLLDTMEGFQKGDPVSFEYIIRDLGGGLTQNWLTKIEKAGSQGGGASAADLPATKDLTLLLEGTEEVRTAKLAVGGGFALYVFDIFSFDPERGVLSMNVDPNYYAAIAKLPEDYNLEDIKKAALDELSRVGEVRELGANEIDPALGGAKLYLTASNDRLVQSVIVKETGGAAFKIKLNKPVGEPMEGFGPHVHASLGTLTNL